jgi:hypothetical protein
VIDQLDEYCAVKLAENLRRGRYYDIKQGHVWWAPYGYRLVVVPGREWPAGAAAPRERPACGARGQGDQPHVPVRTDQSDRRRVLSRLPSRARSTADWRLTIASRGARAPPKPALARPDVGSSHNKTAITEEHNWYWT